MADDTTRPTGKIAAGVARQAEAVQKSATQIEASAGAVERSAGELTDSADRRTVLASRSHHAGVGENLRSLDPDRLGRPRERRWRAGADGAAFAEMDGDRHGGCDDRVQHILLRIRRLEKLFREASLQRLTCLGFPARC